MTEHSVIKGAFNISLIEQIKSVFLSPEFPWYFTPYVAEKNSGDGIYFSHHIYNNFSPSSNHFDLFIPILNSLEVKSLVRIKVNLFPKSDELIEHNWHVDYEFPHKGAVIYLNDNNGFTILEDKTKIPSVQNNVLLFDPSLKHRSTNCTNEKVRLTVNLNYF